jgi:hypothetical protein
MRGESVLKIVSENLVSRHSGTRRFGANPESISQIENSD